MRILGIDPGTAKLGWGVIELGAGKKQLKKSNGVGLIAYGCIQTKVGEIVGKRLLQLYNQLTLVIKKYKPDHIAVEQLFFGVNSRTAMGVGQARGVILLTAEKLGAPLFEYQGLSVKKTITGFGHTDKKKMQQAVRKYLCLHYLPRPDDAADALAIAICHSLRMGDIESAKKE